MAKEWKVKPSSAHTYFAVRKGFASFRTAAEKRVAKQFVDGKINYKQYKAELAKVRSRSDK